MQIGVGHDHQRLFQPVPPPVARLADYRIAARPEYRRAQSPDTRSRPARVAGDGMQRPEMPHHHDRQGYRADALGVKSAQDWRDIAGAPVGDDGDQIVGIGLAGCRCAGGHIVGR